MKALVLVDIQNDFVDGSLGSAEAQAIIPSVVQLINENPWDVVYVTQDTHHENYLQTQEGRNLPILHCQKGSEGWLIQKDALAAVNGLANTHFIEKGAFGFDNWEAYVDPSVDDITFAGIATDICVINNALILKSILPEANMRVIANCCAGITPASHEDALKVMAMNQIEIVQ